MANYDLSKFEWFEVGPTPPEMAVNVSDSGAFTFKGEAKKNLPAHIRVGAASDGKTICIQEGGSQYTIPKSGRVKLPRLLEKSRPLE